MLAFKRFLTPMNVIGTAVAVAAVSIGAALILTARTPAGTYTPVSRGPVTEVVTTTGTVKAADTIDLSFDTSGRIASVSGTVGTHVAAGHLLASLSGADAAAALSQAQAALAVQEAKLAGLQAGARPEDIAVSEAALTGAQNSLAQAKQSLAAAARDSYVKADAAVRNKVDQFFTNPRTANPILSFTLPDSNTQTSMIAGRISMETLLSAWQQALAVLPADATQIDPVSLSTAARVNTGQVSAYLDTVAAGLSTLTPSAQLPLATVQKYQSDIATARATMSAAVSAINAAQTAETGAEAGVSSAQAQLRLKEAGASAQDVAAQEAAVQQAQANVQAAQAAAAKTVIRAPIAGTITRNDAHLGATAAPGIPLITLISDAQFQIESYVSEADLAKVSAGQEAQVRLDAYPDSPVAAKVVSIDPAASLQSGTAGYKVTLQFAAPDARVKSGLTANITITVAHKDDALLVPTSAVIRRGDQSYVLRASASGDELVPVTLGLEGQDSTEVLTGVQEGDRIRSFGNSTN